MSVNDFVSNNNIPAWMKQAERGIDWGALLIIAFSVVAVWSLLTQGGQFSATSANEAYLYQIGNYTEAFEQQIIYPRWSPHTLQGYGAPIPHYYPSGSAYAGGLLQFLFTNDAQRALRLLYALSIILGGSMMYTFVAQRTTAFSGMIAALLYTVNPYILVTQWYIVGDLPLVMGFALLPSLLWTVNRLLIRNQPIDVLLIAIIVAITIVTVPVVLLLGALSVLVLLSVECHKEISWEHFSLIIIGVLSGIFISAFYWFPILVDFTRTDWYPAAIGQLIPHITLQDLWQIAQPLDEQSVNQIPSYSLGWAIGIAQLGALIITLMQRKVSWLPLSYFLLGLVVMVYVVIFVPNRPIWLLLILFCLAISGSHLGMFDHKPSVIQLVLGWSTLMITLVLGSLNWITPSTGFPIVSVSPQSQFMHEASGWGIATLPRGYPLPSYMPPEQAQAAPFSASSYNSTVNRLVGNRSQIAIINESPYQGTYSISTQDSIQAIYRRAYFHLWQARTTDASLEITESQSHEIQINIPENTNSDVQVTLRADGIIWLGRLISIVGFSIIVGTINYRWQAYTTSHDESTLLTTINIRSFALLLVAFITLRILVSTDLINVRDFVPSDETAPNLTSARSADQNLELIDYQIQQPVTALNKTYRITSSWTLRDNTSAQYLIQLFAVDERNEIVFESAVQPLAFFPTSRWIQDTQFSHPFTMTLPNNDGRYRLSFQVYRCDAACTVYDASVTNLVGNVILPTVIIIE